MLEGYGGQLALVDVAGEHRKVNIGMLPEETFAPGDWVIIHMGFVVEKTDEAGADAAMAGLEMMGSGRDPDMSVAMTGRRRLRVCVHGVVQGVGFRPFVYTCAAALGLTGSVRNDSSGADRRGRRRRHRPRRLPDAARSTSHRRWPSSNRLTRKRFRSSAAPASSIADTSRSGGGRTLASPDVAMCADCAAEQRDPADRRYRHAVRQLHQLRPALHDHRLAALRPRQHHDGRLRDVRRLRARIRRSRRPAVPRATGLLSRLRARHCATERGRHADRRASRRCSRPGSLLRDGGVLAVKGIGGYHLACDARQRARGRRASARKRRGDKPFAVMVPDLARRTPDRDDR